MGGSARLVHASKPSWDQIVWRTGTDSKRHMETQQELHKARPPVLPFSTCRKTITPHPPPLLGWRILFGPVSAAVRIKARGWEGKVWKDVAPLLRTGIYLRLWHSKSSVTASRPGREADSLCRNKEQRTETEWGRGSHSLCRSALWPLHSARVASTFMNLENSADVISLWSPLFGSPVMIWAAQQQEKHEAEKKTHIINHRVQQRAQLRWAPHLKSMLLW